MKKVLSLVIAGVLLLSSCSVFAVQDATATPVPPTSMPTPTLDPCSPEIVTTHIEEIQALVNGFQSTMAFANSILNPDLVVDPILKLQEIQLDVRLLDAPECLLPLKQTILDYMDSVIIYLVFYLNQNTTQEEFDILVESSNQRWNLVATEFNKALQIAGIEPQEVPELGQVLPESEGTGAMVQNEGTQNVNVRAAPDLTAEKVTELEPGAQAFVFGRNDGGDWIRVEHNGVLGWVFAETVTVSVAVDDLPVIEAGP